MSAFSDFINLLKLRVNIYHNAKVCGNWVLSEHTLGATCFHIVTMGRCFLKVPGYFEGVFNTGDLVIFPRELAHTMHSIGESRERQQHLDYSTSLEGTGMLCGEVSVLHLYRNQLLDALPAVMMIRNNQQASWLSHLVELILAESSAREQANSVTLNRLSELLFIYALRHYLKINTADSGILALYASEKIAKAIKAFHLKPEFKWELSSLALQAGMSRTVFAKTFKQLSGWTVNRYVTWWRMQIAWEKLQDGDKVSSVAALVGYQSEAAFSRAFSKHFATSAGQVRRGSLK